MKGDIIYEKTRGLLIAVITVVAILMFSGCSSYSLKSYTFEVETGDKIKIEIIEESSNDNIDYFFYKTRSGEHNYIIGIKDSNTCFILGNNVSKSSAREVFKRLKFKVD